MSGRQTFGDVAARAARWRRPATSWSGALVLVLALIAVLWVVQAVNAAEDYRLDRFGVRPREVAGLWGVLTEPFLHSGWGQLLSNSVSLLAIGWVLMLSGLRVFAFVSAVVILLGDFGTWLIGGSNTIVVGASGLVFGWLGYLLARAWFSRRVRWILVAAGLLFVFGTLLGSMLPTVDRSVSWQAHVSGFVVGVGCGWFLHARGSRDRRAAESRWRGRGSSRTRPGWTRQGWTRQGPRPSRPPGNRPDSPVP